MKHGNKAKKMTGKKESMYASKPKLTTAQKRLPVALQKAILKKKGK